MRSKESEDGNDEDMRRHQLGLKLRLLEESIVELDRRLEREGQSSCSVEELACGRGRLTLEDPPSYVQTVGCQGDTGSLQTYSSTHLDYQIQQEGGGDYGFDVLLGESRSRPILEELTGTPAEVQEEGANKLFLSWDCSRSQFSSRWAHQEIGRILEEAGGEALDIRKLKDSIAQVSSQQQIADGSVAKEQGPMTGDEAREAEVLARAYEARLQRLREEVSDRGGCLVQDVRVEDDLQIPPFQLHQVDDLPEDADRGQLDRLTSPPPLLDEDTIIDCFQEPDYSTDYGRLSVPEVFGQLSDLQSRLSAVQNESHHWKYQIQ